MTTFKIRVNGTPLAACFQGESTGLDSALHEFAKRLHRAEYGSVLELLAVDADQKIILKKVTK